jgi:hypothetical protein
MGRTIEACFLIKDMDKPGLVRESVTPSTVPVPRLDARSTKWVLRLIDTLRLRKKS